MQSPLNKLVNTVGQVLLGKEEQVNLALACLIANGHLLIEDLPGMGKTTLAQCLGKVLGLDYQRVQFTSDLMPADILGVAVFDKVHSQFKFHPGPVFTQLLLADEINRASPKTQSALLEAMEERQVSIDGKTHALDWPFFVIATQNPTFHAGTYPLPESQLDRFMMKISLGFPDRNAEKSILLAPDLRDGKNNKRTEEQQDHQNESAVVNSSLTIEQLRTLQQAVTQVNVNDSILDYIISLCQVTRQSDSQVNPLSPRAAKSLLAAAKAWAFIQQRDYVLPDDVQAVFDAVCSHRMFANNAFNGPQSSDFILQQVDVVS